MVTKPYISADESCLSQDELRDFLVKNKLFNEEADNAFPAERFWPDGKSLHK
jgi:hypothetical protein